MGRGGCACSLVTRLFLLYSEKTYGNYNFSVSLSLSEIKGWGVSPRGAGFLFGSDVVQEVQFSYRDLLSYSMSVGGVK